MSSQMVTARLPWQDRWTQPTVEQLLEPLDDDSRAGLVQLIDLMDTFDNVERELVWYGESWKWTIHYYLAGQGRTRQNIQTMAYLVPRDEQSLVCVPMRREMIEDLPMRRLTKFIREGVTSAKCAVEIHWANWTPGNATEFNTLVDLLRRKYNFLTLGTTSLAKAAKKD